MGKNTQKLHKKIGIMQCIVLKIGGQIWNIQKAQTKNGKKNGKRKIFTNTIQTAKTKNYIP